MTMTSEGAAETSETSETSSAFVGGVPDLQDFYDRLPVEKQEIADRIAQLCELENLINQLIESLPEGLARDQAVVKTFEAFAWMCETLRFD